MPVIPFKLGKIFFLDRDAQVLHHLFYESREKIGNQILKEIRFSQQKKSFQDANLGANPIAAKTSKQSSREFTLKAQFLDFVFNRLFGFRYFSI